MWGLRPFVYRSLPILVLRGWLVRFVILDVECIPLRFNFLYLVSPMLFS